MSRASGKHKDDARDPALAAGRAVDRADPAGGSHHELISG